MASLTAINGTAFADIVMGKRTTRKTVSIIMNKSLTCVSRGWQACIHASSQY